MLTMCRKHTYRAYQERFNANAACKVLWVGPRNLGKHSQEHLEPIHGQGRFVLFRKVGFQRPSEGFWLVLWAIRSDPGVWVDDLLGYHGLTSGVLVHLEFRCYLVHFGICRYSSGRINFLFYFFSSPGCISQLYEPTHVNPSILDALKEKVNLDTICQRNQTPSFLGSWNLWVERDHKSQFIQTFPFTGNAWIASIIFLEYRLSTCSGSRKTSLSSGSSEPGPSGQHGVQGLGARPCRGLHRTINPAPPLHFLSFWPWLRTRLPCAILSSLPPEWGQNTR